MVVFDHILADTHGNDPSPDEANTTEDIVCDIFQGFLNVGHASQSILILQSGSELKMGSTLVPDATTENGPVRHRRTRLN